MSRYPTWFSIREIALFLGLTREKVRLEILGGELKAARYGARRTHYRVELEDFRAYCQMHGCQRVLDLLTHRYPPAA